MAPTIWCRGGPSDFHRKQMHPEGGSGAAGIRTRLVPHPQPIAADKEAEAAPPHMHRTGDGSGSGSGSAEVASRRGAAADGVMSTAAPAPRPSSGGGKAAPFPSATDLILRRVAFARRRQRRGGVSATWCQSRASSCHDVTSGDDSAMISTTGHAATPSSCCSLGIGEATRRWAAKWPSGGEEGHEWPTKATTAEEVKGLRGPRGLLGITVRTVELMRRNQLLQWRLSLLQEETRAFVESVLSNPENRREDSAGGEGATAEETKDQDPAVSGSC